MVQIIDINQMFRPLKLTLEKAYATQDEDRTVAKVDTDATKNELEKKV